MKISEELKALFEFIFEDTRYFSIKNEIYEITEVLCIANVKRYRSVIKVKRISDNRLFVLKLFSMPLNLPVESFLRFDFFLDNLHRLSSCHVVTVIDAGYSVGASNSANENFTAFNCAYILMDFIDAPSLRESIKANLEYKLSDCRWFEGYTLACVINGLTIILSIAMTLQELLNEGLYYTDLKPDNIMVIDETSVVFIDPESIVSVNEFPRKLYWTRGFMAPERYRSRKFNIKESIFALGAIFSLILGNDSLAMIDIEKSIQRSMKNCPESQSLLYSLVVKMLEENPAKRPGLNRFIRDLNTILSVYKKERAVAEL